MEGESDLSLLQETKLEVNGKEGDRFHINTEAIECVAVENQPDELRQLGLTVYDQSKFEESVLRQVDEALDQQERLENYKRSSEETISNDGEKKRKTQVPNFSDKETETERLVRLGQLTPFGTTLNGSKIEVKNKELSSFERYLIEQENLQKSRVNTLSSKGKSLKQSSNTAKPNQNNPTHKCKVPLKVTLQKTSSTDNSDSEYIPSDEDVREQKKSKSKNKQKKQNMDKDYDPSEEESRKTKKIRKGTCVIDDGNLSDYQVRLTNWLCTRQDLVEEEEECEEFDGGYRLPKRIWNLLYSYQKVGVRWMWELHLQRCGGILGDEMGLGKTIQIIAFLAGLAHSNLLTKQAVFRGLGPVLLVTPATVMHQWVKEFHIWWPSFRVAILHDSGSYSGSRDSLIRSINKSSGILITSYTGVVLHQKSLLALDWHYLILDEGHKIRNPDAQTTLAVKQFRTCHRFILSGSPMQNNLRELWSLFDFIFPGKLGTLPVFLQQFAVPITQGGYANASQVQVATAYKCATVLKETISPYLLRRMKADVKNHIHLPDKNEQVLFCRLTDEQRELYKGYLDSGDIKNIIDGRLQIFVGLTNLRKICNHPDIFSGKYRQNDCTEPSQNYGYAGRSGKMLVVESLLRIWKEQQHRVLLFTQSRKMLDILESFVQQHDYKYLRMDGSTSINARQPMIQQFNSDISIYVFLLTTRVGGLGVNLTGADRVVIYDPDWNPSTDTQARERAWRIGQRKDVTIYRLLTSGTIEEKIYHRQIFKQYLTNRVLKDPKQRRFFKSNDLYELFTLKETGANETETEAIFAGTDANIETEKRTEVTADKYENEEWMKRWKKERELREKLWKKELEKQKKKEESKIGSRDDVKKKRKTEKEKEKKTKKEVQIDGCKVNFVLKKAAFRSSAPEPPEQEASTSSSQDDYVLRKLFAKSGILSALRHDSIVNPGDPDYVLVEGEAERVAKLAVQELKHSRRQCYNAQSGIPTWTGQSGTVRSEATIKPRFGQKKKTILEQPSGGLASTVGCSVAEPNVKIAANEERIQETDPIPSSSNSSLSSGDLLKRMRTRNQLLGVPNSDNNEDDHLQSAEREEELIHRSDPIPLEFATGVNYRDMIDDIRSFVAFRGVVPGQVTTEDIVNEFNNNLPERSAALFRSLLKQLCNFTRNSQGQGIWQLKGEFL